MTRAQPKTSDIRTSPAEIVREYGPFAGAERIHGVTHDGQHVWAMMGTGEIGCYTLDGRQVWKFNLQDRYGKFDIQFGMTSTPVLDGDRLYLQLLHSGGPLVLALDKATGGEIWKQTRKSDARAECEHSYASPVLYRDERLELLQDVLLLLQLGGVVLQPPLLGLEVAGLGLERVLLGQQRVPLSLQLVG